MESIKRILITSILFIVIVSCSKQDSIKDTVTNLINQSVIIDLDSMIKIDPLKSPNYDTIAPTLTYVVFADSNECSNCYLSKLSLWNEYIELESKKNGKIRFRFIIDTKEEMLQPIIKYAKYIDFEHSLYIDKHHSFMSNNLFLPKQSIYHTFLLNKDNQIVLVGNPIHNNKIETLLNKEIEKRIGKNQPIKTKEK